MRRFLFYIVLALLSFTVAHVVTLQVLPGLIMSKAMTAMEGRGIMEGAGFVRVPRSTPQTQVVVRPSPDLAYSVCMFDFTKNLAPLRVQAARWTDYSSVSFFDARTNVFSVQSLRAGQSSDVRLMFSDVSIPQTSVAGPPIVYAPTKKGLILIRRLAPAQDDYDRVVPVSLTDVCARQ